MSVAGLRDAFNSVSAPQYNCQKAFMATERSDGKEWSRLIFRGTRADGTPFETASDLVPGNSDVMLAAKQTAQKLIGP
jgi:hypothetical protein